MIESLIPLFQRDLGRLVKEIEAYSDESILWTIEGQVNNSAGTLCLHLVGNLNHFIGATLGETGYVRHRESEFSTRNVPATELVKMVNATSLVVSTSLEKLLADDIDKDYPINVFGDKTPPTTGRFLIHLYGHLNYHLGQISYHRRLLDK
jgi:uncharacterized damage-inducible protein DinB